jgi:mannose-6-phosphate isomerase-like protein (cupin superfamily)
MRILTEYRKIQPYPTKDGSLIRELIHPSVHGNSKQSLAEATVPPGASTALHRHVESEEIYHVTHGSAVMSLGDERFRIWVGDTICIPPGTPHRLENTGDIPFRVLCCCTPPYAHDDTELISMKGTSKGPAGGLS